ncbi:flagellar basal-body rod protein FlgG [Erythrobacter litoralis]|uniref:Flagellar basal-body rod protein FlgG n=1 Tax=Erythrobacter litoralis TaxID=39960 RepID=A0A074MC16_9SPHN|nr:flagellar basal-body rod protein FlgG [Erythrobacter litoralis]AOL22261.1 flagellar basal-body rod protein FlgG [Erythrobacter litoralis]KEO90989.1 flagellar basal body rod protein FlgG [Erythrobacter litoralis]MEE4337413.1 flagellar basal-body rod protein FlgG [Erythrobacter sp.]
MPTSALHVARTGLEAQDARMRVIANNLANIGTTGFKRDRADFATLAYQEQRIAGQQSTGQTAFAVGLNLGTGVQIQGTTRIETQGTLNGTGNSLDLALDGPGYFQVELPPGGQIAFTRAGNFTLSVEGQLITSQGYAVQPPVQVPQGAQSISIAPDGTISAVTAQDPAPVQLGQLTLASFVNPAGLRAIGDNFLIETAASGPAEIGLAGENGRGQVRQGMLEGSNVNVVEELVEMIEAQRAYEINSKMVSAVDEMLRNANQTL